MVAVSLVIYVVVIVSPFVSRGHVRLISLFNSVLVFSHSSSFHTPRPSSSSSLLTTQSYPSQIDTLVLVSSLEKIKTVILTS